MDPLANLMACLALYGTVGLFAVGLAERFVPVMPSYGMLLAIGVSSAEGAWGLPVAFAATTLGSVLGCAACFYAVRSLGEARSRRFLEHAGRFVGMPGERVERRIAAYVRNRTALAFSFQLLPTVRLFAPTLAGLLPGQSLRFLAASSAGIAVWNGLFLGAGYLAFHSVRDANTTLLALSALGCLLAAQATMFLNARRTFGRRKPSSPSW
ncbi:DedA family protein [Aureimonas jatrophae]|jgi:membrane protein DedA with SNARE-associated domain|uniref:Membrane protein DedA, SNARE-associated domain n=1 Tax=Aureimonas jatrophae TaxID=1166073 RepID=A0A1H0DGH7_9HYPH|nr:VTT domain-containing protein [Aureimonas jatrophae]MBB3951873.1 membrane protein DedA with SNARE-associated domain [Aureimonas jatrophae]SDN69091.1 membrane protein DedA, SNARE-associated domain [Aureimonas jatrophae]